MTLLSFLIYIPLQIAFIPLAIIGVSLVAYRQILVSRKLGASQTAIEILNGRWTMHIFGIRTDEACARLAAELPNTSLFGLWLCLFPLWLKYRISGKLFLYPRIAEPGSEQLADMVVARTLYFDQVIERQIGNMEQFVVMGAGYDTRAYGRFRNEQVTFFELDQAGTQLNKRNTLTAAGIDADHVRFVAVDFSSENAFEKLTQAGYDPTKKSLFLWEGVTLYLSEADVRKTMQEAHRNAPSGSVLLADLYAQRMLNIGKRAGARQVLESTDEGFGFGLNLSESFDAMLTEFAMSESFSVGETFFLGRSSDEGPYMVVAEMIR